MGHPGYREHPGDTMQTEQCMAPHTSKWWLSQCRDGDEKGWKGPFLPWEGCWAGCCIRAGCWGLGSLLNPFQVVSGLCPPARCQQAQHGGPMPPTTPHCLVMGRDDQELWIQWRWLFLWQRPKLWDQKSPSPPALKRDVIES